MRRFDLPTQPPRERGPIGREIGGYSHQLRHTAQAMIQNRERDVACGMATRSGPIGAWRVDERSIAPE